MSNVCLKESIIFLNLFTVTALEPEGILGGDESPLGQYTYQLSLRIDGDDDCGAGILDENHVITGAHCVADRDDGFHDETLQIVGGTNDLNCDTSTRVTVDVETIYIPAAYMTTEHDADIAVLKVNEFRSIFLHTMNLNITS